MDGFDSWQNLLQEDRGYLARLYNAVSGQQQENQRKADEQAAFNSVL